MSLGQDLQASAAAIIAEHGSLLTVSRSPIVTGADPTEQQIRFLVEPLTRQVIGDLAIEGLLNMANDAPTRFICAATETIAEAVYFIHHGNPLMAYRVQVITSDEVDGVPISKNCYGVRERPV